MLDSTELCPCYRSTRSYRAFLKMLYPTDIAVRFCHDNLSNNTSPRKGGAGEEEVEEGEGVTEKASETTLEDQDSQLYINELIHNYMFYEPNSFYTDLNKGDYSVNNYDKVKEQFIGRIGKLKTYLEIQRFSRILIFYNSCNFS